MRFILKTIIKAYSYLISPLLGQNCRFHPTCSSYCCEAIDKHGSLKGIVLGIKRLCKCHPLCSCEYHDPVPDTIAWKQIIGYNRIQPKNNNT